MPGINLYLILHLIKKRQYPPCLTEEEINQLINKPNISRTVAPRDKAIMQTLYSTGIRNTELTELKITDIDFNSNLVYINLKPRWFSQIRTVPIGKIACEYIQIYLKKTRPLFVKDNDQGYLFLFVNGEKMNMGYITKLIRVNARLCGLNTVNSFRLAYAVHMHKNGTDINYLMQTLGFINRLKEHKSLSTDELKQIYFKCHPSEKHLDKAVL